MAEALQSSVSRIYAQPDTNGGLAIMPEERVDMDAGKIRGLSMLTANIQAKGHYGGTEEELIERWTDDETLKTFMDCVEAMNGEPLKAMITHDGDMKEIVGYFENFRIDGDRVRADFVAYKDNIYAASILRQAKDIPSQFGVSIVAKMVWSKVNGIEIMRILSLSSGDFVSTPAVNNGLFSVDKSQQSNQITNTNGGNQKMNTEEMEKKIEELESREDQLEKRMDEMEGVTDRLQSIEDKMSEYEKKMTSEDDMEKDEMTEEEKAKAEEKAEEKEQMKALRQSVEKMSQTIKDMRKLGLEKGASPSDESRGNANGETFMSAISSKLQSGKKHIEALKELKKERPDLIEQEMKARGINNPNYL